MLMAASAIFAMAANAQTSPEAKAIKKMKTYAEVVEAFKAQGAAMSDEDKAFCYNKIAECAKKESEAAEKAALEAQLAKNEAVAAEQNAKKNDLACEAIANAQEAYKLNPKAMKIGGGIMGLRSGLVNAGLDAYNAKNYAGAAKYFGMFVESRTSPMMAKQDFSAEQNFDQIAYYAALAAYFSKAYDKCSQYADVALGFGNKEIENDVVTVKLGAIEGQAKDGAIDTTQYINGVKAMYDKMPENETIFGKLIALYDESGKKDDAKALLNDRLAKNPNDAMANAFIAQNAQAEAKYPEAIEAYKKALAAKPDFLAAKLNLGVCYLNKAANAIDANTDARGNIKPDVKDSILADLNLAKTTLEEVKAADPDKAQVNWSYPLERVNYALENIK